MTHDAYTDKRHCVGEAGFVLDVRGEACADNERVIKDDQGNFLCDGAATREAGVKVGTSVFDFKLESVIGAVATFRHDGLIFHVKRRIRLVIRFDESDKDVAVVYARDSMFLESRGEGQKIDVWCFGRRRRDCGVSCSLSCVDGFGGWRRLRK